MPGQGCPHRQLCSPQNNFAPAQWQGELARCALVFSLALIGLMVQLSTARGQRNQTNDLFQNESIQHEGFGRRLGSGVNLRGAAKRKQRRNQSCPPLARRRLFPLRRLEHDQVVDRPRLAEVIKSRESLRLVEGDWQAITFERDTAGLFQAHGQLPDRQFSDVPHEAFENLESLPLAVRQSRSGEQFYFYLANSSPWRLRVRMRLPGNTSEQTINNIESLPNVKFDFNSYDAENKVLSVDLMPYDLAGGWAPMLGPIESYSFEYLDDVASDLRKRVFALQVKLQQAQQTRALRILSNPKFLAGESNSDLIQGWEIGQQMRSRFQLLDHSMGQRATAKQQAARQSIKPAEVGSESMEAYLRIYSCADDVTWIRSQPITPTETGRLSISVWLRVQSGPDGVANKVPEVRLAIDGQTSTDDYYRFGVVGREPVGSLASLGANWKRFAVHFDDLPSSLTDLRIGFDVVGEGVIEVSQVDLYDRWFDNGDAKRITQLLASADEMLRNPAHFDRCRRLLEEPWAVFLDDHFLLKPVPKSAQQPVPMFRPKGSQASASKQKTGAKENGETKAGQSLKR